MAVFRVQKTQNYTIMSNHHLRNKALSRDEGLRQREYRKFLIGRYVALFKIDELRNTVEIYRIFHGTQNYTKYL